MEWKCNFELLNKCELEFLKRHIENPYLIETYSDDVRLRVENKLKDIIAILTTDNYTHGVDEIY